MQSLAHSRSVILLFSRVKGMAKSRKDEYGREFSHMFCKYY